MVEIRLTDSRTGAKRPLEPLVTPGRPTMYVCGPTVYDRAHLGNARPVVVFDVLFRLLRHVYGADNVTYVRNVTDVDDKINARAAERGVPIETVTEETLRWFHEDMAALGALPPTHEPRATAYIPQMVAMIETLIARGHAYAAEGHVLFAVRSFADYGALSGRSLDDMIAGARVEVAPFKRDPMDFVLWKPSGADEPGWDSPWGRGRPGWHIECSAMSRALLGESFDIHGGGLDLLFPHHENEFAQSCCATDGSFARLWMHNEMLLVDGKKMSKSLGNFFTVRDLLAQGVPGEVIRYVMLMTHYRKPMDWTEAKRVEAERLLNEMSLLVEGAHATVPDPAIILALADDLNTPLALQTLRKLRNEVVHGRGEIGTLLASSQMLGLSATPIAAEASDIERCAVHRIEELVQRRTNAKTARDYDTSDRIRQLLGDVTIELKDGPDATQYLLNWSLVYGRMLLETDIKAFHEVTGVDRERAAIWLLRKLEALA